MQENNLTLEQDTSVEPASISPALDIDVESDEQRQVGRSLNEVARPRINRQRNFLNEIIETLLLVIAIYVLVNLSTARFVVDGSSMEPNFHTDEYIIVSRLSYILGDPERGDVVVFHKEADRDFIKRVIGLPGEKVELIDGRIRINGRWIDEPYLDEEKICRTCADDEWVLGENEYFVLGDNRRSSQDSHNFGPINREQIVGKAWVRYWPLEDLTMIPGQSYEDSPENIPAPTAQPILPTATRNAPPEIENQEPGSSSISPAATHSPPPNTSPASE